MNTALSHEKLLSRVETAARLGVSLRKVDYLTASGELTCVKAGRRTLFRMQDIDTYITQESHRLYRKYQHSGNRNADNRFSKFDLEKPVVYGLI